MFYSANQMTNDTNTAYRANRANGRVWQSNELPRKRRVTLTEQPAAPQGEGKTPENVAVTPQGEMAAEQASQPTQPNRFPVSAIVGIGAAAVIAAIVLLFVRKRK